jgi:hypothetical protein
MVTAYLERFVKGLGFRVDPKAMTLMLKSKAVI